MPEVYVHAVEGRTLDQKRALVKDITAAVVKHFNATPEAVMVQIVESPQGEQSQGRRAVQRALISDSTRTGGGPMFPLCSYRPPVPRQSPPSPPSTVPYLPLAAFSWAPCTKSPAPARIPSMVPPPRCSSPGCWPGWKGRCCGCGNGRICSPPASSVPACT